MHHYQSILIAVDFSTPSQAALARGVQLAGFYNASVQVVHVVDIPTYPVLEDVAVIGLAGVWDPQLTEQLTQVATQNLDKMLSNAGLDKTCGHLLMGDASTEIVSHAANIKADLIVMGRHGVSGWQHLLGSTTNTVLNRALCDVLTIKLDKE